MRKHLIGGCAMTLLCFWVSLSSLGLGAQTVRASGADAATAEGDGRGFEVATIKPTQTDAGGVAGFLAIGGGRVRVGGMTVKQLVQIAFSVADFQVSGGPRWVDDERYDIEALDPSDTASAKTKGPQIRTEPTGEECAMLALLLRERFALRSHKEPVQRRVYLLTRGKSALMLEPAKDPKQDPRAHVMTKAGGIADGEAFGQNVSMGLLARRLGAELGRPVIDQTGLAGRYDFHVPPLDPTNHEVGIAVIEAVRRLGLDLKPGRGPVIQMIIDSVSRPTEN